MTATRAVSETEPDLRRQLRAILAADAVGYSRLMADDDRAALALLDRARGVFRFVIGNLGGRVIDTAGDSVLAAFESATAAVQAAIAVQLRLQPGMPFRIGVHLGDVIEKADGSVYGDGVNIAARLQASAEPGGILVSQAIHAIVASRGIAAFEDAGELVLKNVAQPLQAWRVRHPAASSSSHGSLRFGRFELQHRERRLLVDGEPANIAARAFDLLLALATQPGALLTKNQLMDWAWPAAAVSDGNLAAHMRTLRKVLGDDVIETIPGRGYRLVAPVDDGAGAAARAPAAGSAGDAYAPTPIASAPATVRTNLPQRLPTLFGRGVDLADLETLIAEHPLVTLVGAGGMGKSSLAQAFLHAHRDDRATWKHGVCWVELATVTDAAALPGTVAAALGIRIGSSEPSAGLCAAVAPLTMLVALDNAEHLIDGVARLARALLDAAPGVRLLVTSQAPLKVAGERVYRLESLAVPEHALPAAQALRFGAVALFVERAQAADARFALTDANAPAVIELCRALDGLALAIELAAARAPVLGVQRLANSMQERLKLLTSSRNRTAPARQQTLRAALEWSHAFLDAQAAKVFRRLAVFASSGSLAVIQHVVADSPGQGDLDEWAVLDALSVLVERSMATVLGTDDSAEPRYRLLDSPRAYALERLKEAGEEAAVRLRHVHAMAAFCDATSEAFYSGALGYNAWMQAMALDAHNARQAMAHAEAVGDRIAVLRIGTMVLQALATRPVAHLTEVVERCVPLLDDDVPAPLRARAWIEIAGVYSRTQPPRAREAAQRALDVVRRSADPIGDAWLHYHACCMVALTTLWSGGDRASVQALLAEARHLEDGRWPAARLLSAVEVELGLAAPGSAEQQRLLHRRLTLWLAAGGSGYVSRAMIAESELAAGDAAAAVRTGEALLADLRDGRDEYWLAYAQMSVTAAYLALNDVPRARRGAEAGWPLALLFALQCPWASYLTLLAALERRPRAAARLAGYADATYLARSQSRESNEATAFERACRLAQGAIGEAAFAQLAREGSQLQDEQVAAIAFADVDV